MTTTVTTHLDITVDTGPLEILAVAVVIFALAFLVSSFFIRRPPPPSP
jgi:hypothetical protein